MSGSRALGFHFRCFGDTNVVFSRQWIWGSFLSCLLPRPLPGLINMESYFCLYPSPSLDLFFTLKLSPIWKFFGGSGSFPRAAVIKYYRRDGLKQQEFIVSRFWMSPKSRCWQAGLAPSGSSEGESFPCFPPASSSFCQLLAFLGLYVRHSDLLIHHHVLLSCLCVLSSSSRDAGYRIQDEFVLKPLPYYICQDLISHRGHVLRGPRWI